MNAVVVDAATRDKLLAAGNGVVAVQDESGKLIGRFVIEGPPTPPAGYAIEGEWPSDVELDRREREGKRYSATEVEVFLKGMKRGWEARNA